MIQFLSDYGFYLIALLSLVFIGGFIAICVHIKVTELRAKRARRKQPKKKPEARMTLVTEDGRAVDMTPYVRDVSFSAPDPPEWATRIADPPDASVTIEMETITEEDHGTSRSRQDPRTGEAD